MGNAFDAEVTYKLKLAVTRSAASETGTLDFNGIAIPEQKSRPKRKSWRDAAEENGGVKLEKWTTPQAYALCLTLLNRWGALDRAEGDSKAAQRESFHYKTKELAMLIHAALFDVPSELWRIAKQADERRLQKLQLREGKRPHKENSDALQRHPQGTGGLDDVQNESRPQSSPMVDDAIEKSMLAICRVLDPVIRDIERTRADHGSAVQQLATFRHQSRRYG